MCMELYTIKILDCVVASQVYDLVLQMQFVIQWKMQSCGY